MNKADKLIGWALSAAAAAIYLLTLEPSVSFWDCGEFLSVARGLEVGHPPGAPFYSLVEHCLMLLAGSNGPLAAQLGNSLSAISGGLTVGLLYWTLRLMAAKPFTPKAGSEEHQPAPASWRSQAGCAIGALCYMVCDTAWFSAVESEVYAFSMLLSAAILWAAMKWAAAPDRTRAPRWLLLASLLLGLSIGVHQLSLLTLPSVALIFLFRCRRMKHESLWLKQRNRRLMRKVLPLSLLLFLIGISTYAVIPIRAAANPPINEGRPSTAANFKRYISRDQYAKAPLWPRSWRNRPADKERYASWQGSGGDFQLLATYQLGYMYFRYLMWNFSGRYNDRQGFGSVQDGQMLTGIGFIDNALVGTAARPPESLPNRGRNIYFLLPLILGLLGAFSQAEKRKHSFWCTLTLFLMGGIILGLYLNHPVYEPRERDYAYILSFYAFCIWIGFGAAGLLQAGAGWMPRAGKAARRSASAALCILLFAVPALMAAQNWDDHDRSHRYIAHDSALNLLNSCDRDAILFTYGDNDTFPLWYIQEVEKLRTDVTIVNINLAGGQRSLDRILYENGWQRPVYFSHYMKNGYGEQFDGRLRLEGIAYRLMLQPCDSICAEAFLRHSEALTWHSLDGVYIDPVGCKFLEQYWTDIASLAEHLAADGRSADALAMLRKTTAEIPPACIQDARLLLRIARLFMLAGDPSESAKQTSALKQRLEDEVAYYERISPSRLKYMEYSYGVKKEVLISINKKAL